MYNQLEVINNKSFPLSAVADAILYICLGTNIQNRVSGLQEFKSHLFHFIIPDRFVAKEFYFILCYFMLCYVILFYFILFYFIYFSVFAITYFNDNRAKNVGEGRRFQVVVSSLHPQTKQPFSHSDD